MKRTQILLIVGLIVVVAGVAVTSRILGTRNRARPSGSDAPANVAATQVKVIGPRKGVLERLCVQPGSVHSFESIQLFARVPGFLKFQKVDIGDHVKKDALLAIVDVPDIEAQVERNGAAVEKAQSQLLQMTAHVNVAKANLDAAQAAVTQADATEKSAAAWVKYRTIQLGRMDNLVKTSSIEERLYDEYKDRLDASVESEISAQAAIATTKANVVASKAKIEQAKADIVAAEAEIKVAKAELKKSHVSLAFATITAPFDGVITYRSMNPGDFVRAADGGANNTPLLAIHRTDLFRVVVLVPDRDVEFINTGDTATMELDSLPGRKFSATVSRIATSLDTQTRLMHSRPRPPQSDGKNLPRHVWAGHHRSQEAGGPVVHSVLLPRNQSRRRQSDCIRGPCRPG